MSVQYDIYLEEHIANVNKAAEWLCDHFEDIAKKLNPSRFGFQIFPDHDFSKYHANEYEAYDAYFYGDKSEKVVKAFNRAWLRHIHLNPHHWQHWVLQHDDEGEEILEMPEETVYEMICDWWSFSFKSGNLYEIFDWYEKHKGMKLHPNTRKLVEDTLERIRKELDKKES